MYVVTRGLKLIAWRHPFDSMPPRSALEPSLNSARQPVVSLLPQPQIAISATLTCIGATPLRKSKRIQELDVSRLLQPVVRLPSLALLTRSSPPSPFGRPYSPFVVPHAKPGIRNRLYVDCSGANTPDGV